MEPYKTACEEYMYKARMDFEKGDYSSSRASSEEQVEAGKKMEKVDQLFLDCRGRQGKNCRMRITQPSKTSAKMNPTRRLSLTRRILISKGILNDLNDKGRRFLSIIVGSPSMISLTAGKNNKNVYDIDLLPKTVSDRKLPKQEKVQNLHLTTHVKKMKTMGNTALSETSAKRISQGNLPSSRAVGSPDSRFAQYLAIAVGLSSAILDGVSDLHSSADISGVLRSAQFRMQSPRRPRDPPRHPGLRVPVPVPAPEIHSFHKTLNNRLLSIHCVLQSDLHSTDAIESNVKVQKDASELRVETDNENKDDAPETGFKTAAEISYDAPESDCN
ncbi:hypothetical protein L5515_017341 [Caenorhabditis briggsae]|uniref:Uncharacterized protein n=1 Tax=Caenorhabditis briggsae TaxID=6238 RepID=A0AAE9JSH1_CAEBR|nr:hypothetical protein L5515_017341 [Caenorhabditis briggsae]